MGLVRVDEEEEGRGGVPADPPGGAAEDGRRPSAGVVVDVKTLVEMIASAELPAAVEGRGGVAGLPEDLLQSEHLFTEGRLRAHLGLVHRRIERG